MQHNSLNVFMNYIVTAMNTMTCYMVKKMFLEIKSKVHAY